MWVRECDTNLKETFSTFYSENLALYLWENNVTLSHFFQFFKRIQRIQNMYNIRTMSKHTCSVKVPLYVRKISILTWGTQAYLQSLYSKLYYSWMNKSEPPVITNCYTYFENNLNAYINIHFQLGCKTHNQGIVD